MNYAIEELKRIEAKLEDVLDEVNEDLSSVRQAIADLEEKEMQMEMRRGAGDE